MVSPARIAERKRTLLHILRSREAYRREQDRRLDVLFKINVAIHVFVLCDVLFVCMINKYSSDGEAPETVPGEVETKIMDLKAKSEILNTALAVKYVHNKILESNAALVVKYVHNGICLPLDDPQQPCIPCPEQKAYTTFSVYQFGCMLATACIGYHVSEIQHRGQTN